MHHELYLLLLFYIYIVGLKLGKYKEGVELMHLLPYVGCFIVAFVFVCLFHVRANQKLVNTLTILIIIGSVRICRRLWCH